MLNIIYADKVKGIFTCNRRGNGMKDLKAGYGLDPEGYIVSDVSFDKINKIYKPCIQDSIECLAQLFPSDLHSVYVYGSVARGDAVVVQSDLDLIAMFNRKLSSAQLEELKKLSRKLTNNYQFLVREVGIAVADYDYTMAPSNYYENAFHRELSVCVFGDDVGERFGPYTLTSEIAISFNGDICEALTRTLTRLEKASNEEFTKISQNFARKLIRTYYSMVMVRAQIWTSQLKEQAEVIINSLPEKASIISTLLKWIEELPTDQKTVFNLLELEGRWACEHFDREAHTPY